MAVNLTEMVDCQLVSWVGWLALTFFGAKLAVYFSKYLRSPVNLKKLGSWAVVTGASDGIGKGFCEQLAKKGLNVVLVSRSQDKLDVLAKELAEKFNVETKVIVIDFTKDKNIQEKIESETKSLDVALLVNNVGISYDHPEYFLNLEEERAQAIIDCNVVSMLAVTRAVLPNMVTKKKGAIINMSSFSALCGPLLSVYAGSKAFVVQWTSDMEMEYSSHGITMLCAAPYYVVSKMSKIRHSSFTTPTPGVYAASVLGQLGTTSFTYGYWVHDLVAFGCNLMGPVFPIITKSILKTVRGKALKKKEKMAMEKKD